MFRLSKSRLFMLLTLAIALLLTVGAVSYLRILDEEIRNRFENKRWSLPAIVYARPLELYPSLQLSPKMLESELLLGGYRRENRPEGAGSYTRTDNTIELTSRSFHFPDGQEPSHRLVITFAGDQIAALNDAATSQPVLSARLDPMRIGSFHPRVHEDRIVVDRESLPDLLVETLLLIEDRSFYDHHGVSPLAIARALVANITAGEIVQGGSTLTQQLVKNLFLDRERSLLRKAREAIMAVLLERRYPKDEILTAYANEIFLGQDGNRAIHGFALASTYYFKRTLDDLRPDQIATLVGMIKGPSYYDPYRHIDRCRQRRDLVLTAMADHDLIDTEHMERSLAQPLTDVDLQRSGLNRFPAFLGLVRQQLAEDYREEDLTGDGLQILTTLDPHVQLQVEENLQRTIDDLSTKEDDALEGAVVVTTRETGEVLALAGGKVPARHGFNRALQARRPIGSLIKPAIYLAALNHGYTLASPLLDATITVNPGSADQWQPKNYDHLEHGRVPLVTALANSYNLATVRLGLDLGLERVIEAIDALGYQESLQPLPSLLLGAVEMTPLDVCTLYQTIGAGGFSTTLRAIDSVMTADHHLLTRYGVSIEQRISPEITFLLTHALQRVVREGTGAALLRSPRLRDYGIAGKTGTTDGLRDSWFAGFTGDHLAVVWLGNDDNTPAGITGSAGAMRVWQHIMESIPTAPLEPVAPSSIEWLRINRQTLRQAPWFDNDTMTLPFIAGSGPIPENNRTPVGETIDRTIKGLFDSLNDLLR
ncbi:penicillin-binding protein 1B [Desulfofustis glycolicus]|uniref:Penicillin-binding protein 1B n=1 Tax=Desulfofustis glycolicus DSM 9705 TaxID=1121409 RepID=A0A1M5SF41_9BACT|nr:penicillin-binding protein 1B [Desulfofustis glycolicus]MCB2216142.1 penicillin-binding protein 1B [Desulfobulbaceae bacterium]SHH36523.1 penicillin-binding protein 1B [Desulfofustis glycolicus DSM 9705]